MTITACIDALSDKEKQALRLLVAGHDSKSIARHLDLSVHTVNERLREARRKMGATSSRAAARALHDLESADPNFYGPHFLGDAPTTAQVPATVRPTQAPPGAASRWLIVGVTMMSATFMLFALLSTAQVPTAASTAPPPAASTPAEDDAAQAARAWLALVDAADWRASWRGTSHSFQEANSVEGWAEAATAVQTPLGRVIRHELIGAFDVPSPPAGSRVVRFRSAYANRPEVLLTLSLVREDGAWKVAGIFLGED